MADTSTTTNMGLTIPVPGTRTGPQYASDINGNFIRLDAHDHSELNGVKITPSGMDITSDVDFQGNNITNSRSIRLADQIANLAGVNDITNLYSKSGDLWFNNDAGAQVQLTNGGSLNTGALVTNVWGTRFTNANLTILGSDAFTNINVSSSSAINITLPAANAVGDGRYYVIQDVSGNSQTYNITITPVSSATINGASGAKVVGSNYGTWFVRSDGVSKWQLTYTGFSGLTAASLTYGSTVLNSAGLTVGSVTLTSSTLTIGSATLTDSGLHAATVVTTGAATIGGNIAIAGAATVTSTLGVTGAFTGTSGTFSGNLVVDGNLSVLGTTSIDGSALGISSLTSGTVTNCTITNGSITGSLISEVTMTGDIEVNSGAEVDVTGDMIFSDGGQLQVDNGSFLIVDGTAQFSNTLTTSNFPSFPSAKSKTRSVALQNFVITSGPVAQAKNAYFGPMYGVLNSATNGVLLNDANHIGVSGGTITFLHVGGLTTTTLDRQGIMICLDPMIHDGATLSAVNVSFGAGAGHANLPSQKLTMGVFYKGWSGITLNSMTSSGDFLMDNSSSVSAYQTQHTMTFTPNQGNVIDASNNSYYLQLWNEANINAQNIAIGLRIYGVQLVFNNITDMRFP